MLKYGQYLFSHGQGVTVNCLLVNLNIIQWSSNPERETVTTSKNYLGQTFLFSCFEKNLFFYFLSAVYMW